MFHIFLRNIYKTHYPEQLNSHFLNRVYGCAKYDKYIRFKIDLLKYNLTF